MSYLVYEHTIAPFNQREPAWDVILDRVTGFEWVSQHHLALDLQENIGYDNT